MILSIKFNGYIKFYSTIESYIRSLIWRIEMEGTYIYIYIYIYIDTHTHTHIHFNNNI